MRGFLKSLGSLETAGPVLRKRFKFLGENGSYYFLWSVGEKVPDWSEWKASSSRPSARRSGR